MVGRPLPDEQAIVGPGRASQYSLVGLIMAMSACAREESRGLHTRLDFPETDPVPRESWSRLGKGEVEVELRPLEQKG